MGKPNLSAIIMPTMACNLACDYCYILDKQPGVMSRSLLERTLSEVLEYNDPALRTDVYWHGAEPLLVGIDFYRHACSYIHERYPEHDVSHHVQTNGTLLNDDWFDFFISEKITTGVSLDGYKDLHDAYRKSRDGRGSFDLVLDNVMAARKKKLYFDALCVVTRRTLGHEDELFDFFYQNKIAFGVEPLIPETEWAAKELSITPEEYARVVIRLFDRWLYQAERRIDVVMPAYHFAWAVMTGDNSYCTFAESCARKYITVAPDGQVYSCIMFASHPEMAFGNLTKSSLKEILESPVREEFLKPRAALIKECQECKWLSLCQAGCPYHAFVETGSIMERDSFCTSYRLVFQHVYDTLMNQMERAGNNPVSLLEATLKEPSR